MSFVCACLALLAACSTMPSKLVAPTIEVMAVQVMSADMFAQRFKLRIRVINPNDLELAVRGLEYEVLMMGDAFAEGVSGEAFLLPARGEAEFDMMVTTNFVSSFGRLLSRVSGGKLENVDYEIVGKVLVDKGMVRSIPFNHRGTVDFTKVLKPIEKPPQPIPPK
jgi:LEA14-like dessication related protein